MSIPTTSQPRESSHSLTAPAAHPASRAVAVGSGLSASRAHTVVHSSTSFHRLSSAVIPHTGHPLIGGKRGHPMVARTLLGSRELQVHCDPSAAWSWTPPVSESPRPDRASHPLAILTA